MNSTASDKLLLIDGHSLAFRAYYAFAKGRDGGLRTSTGIPTSVCFGFLKSLLETVNVERPTYMAIAFDLGGPTYRHDADDTYKAGRAETPEDFIPDLNNLQDVLTALNLPIVIAPGYEADDVIGTLARKASQQGWQVKILSGDRDLFQLVDDAGLVRILYLSNAFGAARTNANAQEFGPSEVVAKLEIRPDQVVDYKALCGDASDNIPGVKGIGHKTAVQLLREYDSLSSIYAHLSDIKGAVQKKLAEGHHDALHSQYMAQIHLDVPLEVQPQDFKLCGFNPQAVTPLLEKLEFQAFLRQLPNWQQQLGGTDAATNAVNGSDSASPATPSGDADLALAEDDDTWFFGPEDATPEVTLSPQIIDTPAKLEDLIRQLQTCTDPATPVAWDTET
ncbi:MAG TPA: 5'-3' exonuclease H3TH domain-containing protein, partial [Stenomitos sp.]